uniref:FANCI helical domain-containing protein n=1 Tax=Plectus sambesii TaxID=2011161 RepID=A0A914W3I4_9BILA
MYVTSIKRQKGKTSTQHEESTYDGALHQTQLAAFVNLSQIVGGGGGGGLSSQPNALAVDQTVVKRVNALLRTLAERMADCALEDLEVDKTTDFSAGTTIGLRNAHLAVMFLGVFESLMEHAWWFMNPFSNGADLLLNLFANSSKLLAVLKEKSVSLSNLARKEAADGKKAGAKLSTARVTSNLLLNTLTDMLTKLCCDKKPRHHEGIKKLRDDKEFISWVLESIGDKVTRWQRATEAGLVGDQHEADALQNFVQLAGLGRPS